MSGEASSDVQLHQRGVWYREQAPGQSPEAHRPEREQDQTLSCWWRQFEFCWIGMRRTIAVQYRVYKKTCSRRLSKMLWSIVSNAAERSRNVTIEVFPLSWKSMGSLTIFKRAVSVLCPRKDLLGCWSRDGMVDFQQNVVGIRFLHHCVPPGWCVPRYTLHYTTTPPLGLQLEFGWGLQRRGGIQTCSLWMCTNPQRTGLQFSDSFEGLDTESTTRRPMEGGRGVTPEHRFEPAASHRSGFRGLNHSLKATF